MESNLISGCLCIAFVLIAIWGYTYIPSDKMTAHYLAWRAFFELSAGAWLITNTIVSVTGLVKLIKSTRSPIADKNFHFFMDNIIKEVENIVGLPKQKEQRLINDRNNIFRLILKNEKAKYDNIMFFKNILHYSERHRIKTGLTGWAQINAGYASNIDDTIEKLKYDLYYLKHFNPTFDLLIVLRTISVILFPNNKIY